MKQSLLVILSCFVLCSCDSCSSQKAFPAQNADEVQWKQAYRDGKITWSEYQAKLKTEKKN